MQITTGTAQSNGIEIAYEDMGDPAHPPVLLVMGLGCQLVTWSVEFCQRIVDSGYRVIRFDNRDIGLSTKMEGHRVGGSMLLRLARTELGLASNVPYTIEDMAADAAGLLDHLGIDRVHIAGASMGGMITQAFAGLYPDRVLSVSILFSSTMQRLLPPPDFRALVPLLSPPPKNASRGQIIEHSAKTFTTIGSKKFGTTREERLADAAVAYDRSYYPQGIVRQLAAITGSGSLLHHTKTITVPTHVIHGTADPLIRPSGGKAIHKAVPGSTLDLIDGMGHDLPNPLLDRITGAIVRNATLARG